MHFFLSPCSIFYGRCYRWAIKPLKKMNKCFFLFIMFSFLFINLPITKNVSVVPRGWQAQLVGCVEVVLLLVRTVHHSSTSHHHVTTVTDVGRSHHTLASIQDHDACCAAACSNTTKIIGLSPKKIIHSIIICPQLDYQKLLDMYLFFCLLNKKCANNDSYLHHKFNWPIKLLSSRPLPFSKQ